MPIRLTKSGLAYTQNFDTLSNIGGQHDQQPDDRQLVHDGNGRRRARQ